MHSSRLAVFFLQSDCCRPCTTKSHESSLVLVFSRRVSRLLSASIFQSTSYSRRPPILLYLLSMISLFSSLAAAQSSPSVHFPSIDSTISPSSAILATTTSTLISSSASLRRRPQQASSSVTFPIYPFTVTSELINQTTDSNDRSNKTRSPVHLIAIIVVCSLMCGSTILGNLVVILAVCLVRKLQTASNILIVSLAVSDILVGLLIMPLALVQNVTNNQWIFGSIMCDIWTSTDVFLCTSSILNFLVISIDRYCIINHPFKYAPMRKVKLLSLMITGVWVVSALVSLPPILGWGRPSVNLPICEVNTKLDYQIFATMLSFYIPLILVLIIYANIYRTAKTAMDTRSSVQMSQFLTHNNSSINIAPTPTGLAQQQSNGNSCSSPQLLLPVATTPCKDDNSSVSTGGRRASKRSTTNMNRSKSSSFLSPSRCLGRRISSPFNGRLSVFVSRRHTLSRHAHLPNQKAIRTLGVILGTFIVCWLPFMLFAIVKSLPAFKALTTSTPPSLNVPDWIDPVLLWFGYCSSMLNPLIYSKFNREFRLPFREIIYCRCRGLNEKIRRQEYLDNLYGDSHLQPPTTLTHLQSTTTPARSSSNPEAVV